MSAPGLMGVGQSAGWTTRRVVFLAVSGAAIATLLYLTAEVALSFVLAIIIAYVLTPAVALCERARIPRVVSILLVYAITGTLGYVVIATMAPRIVTETVQMTRDAPSLARRFATRWGPVIEQKVRQLSDHVDTAPPREEAPPAALEVRPLEGGGYSVDIGSGVELVKETETRWKVRPVSTGMQEFSVATLISRSVDQSLHYLRQNALELLRLGQVIVSHIVRGVFMTFMTLMIAGYLIHTREEIVAFFASLPPPRSRASFDRLLHRIDRGLAGVVRGQLVIMVVNGILSAIGFWLFGLKYWQILALVAGIMSIIPIFGSILSTVPAVMIGLTQDPWTALWVLLWIIGIHQIEANLLNPNIIGVAAKLHPALVVFSLVVGEHFYGLWGALLAVPTLSLLKSTFNHFRFESMPDAPADSLAMSPAPGGPDPTRS
jgi:predicted PurR-regulated permease PerM